MSADHYEGSLLEAIDDKLNRLAVTMALMHETLSQAMQETQQSLGAHMATLECTITDTNQLLHEHLSASKL